MKSKYSNVQVEKFKLDEHQNIEEFVENVVKKLDGLDILVNNAGITLDNLSIRLTEEKLEKSYRYKLNFNFFDV